MGSFFYEPMRPEDIMHHGVKGMKWGVRKKYYRDDGSLTRYGQMKADKKSGKLSRAQYRKAKSRYKQDIRKKWQDLNDTTTTGERLLWGTHANKYIARNMVNRGMSRADATKAGRIEALRKSLGASAAALAGRYALSQAPRWIGNAKIAMTNHNMVNDAYARAMGLNEVKGRRTLGLKQLRRGIKLTNAAMKAGRTR